MTTTNKVSGHANFFSHLSASILAVLFVFCLGQTELDGLKGILVDGLFRTQWWKRPRSDIALVVYDDQSNSPYAGNQKFPADEIIRVIDRLSSEAPLAVALIAPLSEKLYGESDLRRIAASLQRIPHAIVGYVDDDALGKKAPPELVNVKYLPGFISRDNFSYGADSVSRRVMISIDGQWTLYAALAALSHGEAAPGPFKNQHVYGKAGNSLQTFIHWQGPAGTYRPISTRDLENGSFATGAFRNKIVLVGSALQSRRWADHIFTPFSREPFNTTLLEGAAHSLATLMDDNGLYKSPGWLNWLLALSVGLVTVNLVLFLSPGWGIALVVGELLGLGILGWTSLFFGDCWLDLAHPAIVVGVGYYLVIPYRLLDEYRKRWHYQEKSELIAQVEQLKSNFLSLMSHDLKTPIARIQGNAELVLGESNLEERARKWLGAIVSTTEDLSQYVETILDFTRVESAQVPVNKVSKDINAMILEVIDHKRFMAAEKNIEFETNLEAIFSFKFDVRLIHRVLSNLVENAIKYSPPETRITIQSKEEGDWIKVSIVDQGCGISTDEQRKIFQKFYRCDNEASHSSKGTGLGLYLVKYFTELHRGMVHLESETGKGSTFTVMLPV